MFNSSVGIRIVMVVVSKLLSLPQEFVICWPNKDMQRTFDYDIFDKPHSYVRWLRDPGILHYVVHGWLNLSTDRLRT